MNCKRDLPVLLLILGMLLPAMGELELEMVRVGDVGNARDPATGGLYGQVNYVYEIGKNLVTNHEYSVFLNHVARTADPHGLYNPEMGSHDHGGIIRAGSEGDFSYAPKDGWENRPVNFVSFRMAARFANWLSNGQGSGSTEQGAYNMAHPITTVTRSSRAAGRYFIANENEWYKAAYYDTTLNGGSGGYWAYATRSNSEPLNQSPPGDHNSANFGNIPNRITDVGAYVLSKSYYGTYDQEGNLAEFTETIAGSGRVRRSSSYWNKLTGSGFRSQDDPDTASRTIGFRVSASLEGVDLAHWDFNSIAPEGVIRDRAGKADARIIGGLGGDLIQPGVYGNAYYFGNGINHLRVDPQLAPTLENDFTIYYVIKPYRVDGFRTIMWKGNRRVDPQQINFFTNIRDGQIEFKTMDSTGEWVNYSTAEILEENQWYRIFIRFSNGAVRINVNGVDRSVSWTSGAQNYWHLLPNEHPLYIGQGASPRGANDYYFHGLVDELKITLGDAVDVSAAAIQTWNQNLSSYSQKVAQYVLEAKEQATLRAATLETMYRDVFAQKASSMEAPFYAVSLPSTRRFVRNKDYILELDQLSRSIALSAAGNEYEGTQLVVLGNPDFGTEGVTVDIGGLVGPEGAILDSSVVEWGWIKDVTTETPDIAVDFVGPIPDVIIEGDETFSVPAGDFIPLFIRVGVPAGTKPGLYQGIIELSSPGFVERIPLSLRVFGFTLPEKGSLRVAFSFSEDYYRNWYGISTLSDGRKRMIHDFLLKYRIPPNDIYSRKQTDPEERFLEELKGKTNFVTTLGWGGDVLEGEALTAKMNQYEAIVSAVEDLGMLEDLYFYGSDELSGHMEANLPAATQASEMISQAYPWLRMMQTSFPIPELRGLYNVWVPLFNYFVWPGDLQLLESLREEGAEIWWYSADDPQHPLPNYFLDYPVFDCRIIMTLSYLYNIDGILYWRINREWETNMDIRHQWPDAEWKPYIYHSTHGTRKWRNGMGNFIYPGPGLRMYPSLRLENLRDGLEDYEYLTILGNLVFELEQIEPDHPAITVARNLLEVPAEVARAIDHYNNDPASMVDYRNHLGLVVEWLSAVLEGDEGGGSQYQQLEFATDTFPTPLVWNVDLAYDGAQDAALNDIIWLLATQAGIWVRPLSMAGVSVGDRFPVAAFPPGIRAEDYLHLFELHPDYASEGWVVRFEVGVEGVYLLVYAEPGMPPASLSTALGAPSLPLGAYGSGQWDTETQPLFGHVVQLEGLSSTTYSVLETNVTGPGTLRFRLRKTGLASLHSAKVGISLGGNPTWLWASGTWMDYAVDIPAGNHWFQWVFRQSSWTVDPGSEVFQIADIRFKSFTFPAWDWWRQMRGYQEGDFVLSPLVHYALGIPLEGDGFRKLPFSSMIFDPESGGGSFFPALIYERQSGLWDVDYRVEHSVDLEVWSPATGGYIKQVELLPDGSERVTVRRANPLLANEIHFFRLHIRIID